MLRLRLRNPTRGEGLRAWKPARAGTAALQFLAPHLSQLPQVLRLGAMGFHCCADALSGFVGCMSCTESRWFLGPPHWGGLCPYVTAILLASSQGLSWDRPVLTMGAAAARVPGLWLRAALLRPSVDWHRRGHVTHSPVHYANSRGLISAASNASWGSTAVPWSCHGAIPGEPVPSG